MRFYAALKAQGVDRRTLSYRAPFQPYLTYYSFTFICVILFFAGWQCFYQYGQTAFDSANFVTTYFPLWFAPCIYIAHATYTKGWYIIKPAEADLVSGSRGVELEEDNSDEPRNVVEKVWKAITA